MAEHALITDAAELEEIVGRAFEVGVVALDTEFVWERTYYPNLGLVQLALDEDEVYLVDPNALDIAPLGEAIKSPSVELVLHDATQDLQILARETRSFPVNVFDTQRAAGFVGHSASISLQDLLRETLRIQVEKGETRSDWMQRPLTPSQLRYAEEDVRHLAQLREHLLARAEDMEHVAWLTEDRRELDDRTLYQEEPAEEAIHRVRGRGVSRLGGRQRAVLHALAQWREEEARDTNRPRRHVLSDETLVRLAQASTRAGRPTETVRLPDKQRTRNADAIERAIAKGKEATPMPTPKHGRPTQEDERRAALVHLFQAVVAGMCARSGIDEKLVATKSDLAKLANGASSDGLDVLKGWRASFLGEDLQRLLAGELLVQVREGWPGIRLET